MIINITYTYLAITFPLTVVVPGIIKFGMSDNLHENVGSSEKNTQ